MSDNETALTVLSSDDGFLVLGSPGLVEGFSQRTNAVSRALGPSQLSKVSLAFNGIARAQEMTGKWVKLTPESVADMDRLGIKHLTSGVLRADNGQILKHLNFQNAALVTPAAPAAIAAMAAQASIEASLDDIKEYLEEIDAKVDRLLKQKKIETLGHIGGIMLALDEADAIYEQTGVVSSVTWSKVQGNSVSLQTMQAEAVGHLASVSDDIAAAQKDADKLANVTARVGEDVAFWLGVLARTIALQDRQYVLELARVTDMADEQLEPHRIGIKIARSERARRLAASLQKISEVVRSTADLSNYERVANPFSSQAVTKHSNAINRSIDDFARHVELEFTGTDETAHTTWGRSARGLLGDTAGFLGAVKSNVAGKARVVGTGVQTRAENALLAGADRIKERRDTRSESARQLEESPGE